MKANHSQRMNITAGRRYRLLVLGCLAHAAFVAADYFFNSLSLPVRTQGAND